VRSDTPKFPIAIRRGSCVVKIYRDRRRSRDYFRVIYYLGGKRHRLVFSSLASAKAEADAKASQLARGDIDTAQLSGNDRLIYGRRPSVIWRFHLTRQRSNMRTPERRWALFRSWTQRASTFDIMGMVFNAFPSRRQLKNS